MGNEETQGVNVNEVVVLSKFDGDGTDPSTEVERITVDDGLVVSHDIIENGEVVGPVEDSEILGKDFGRLISDETVEGVN
jgi:hypothetical protein